MNLYAIYGASGFGREVMPVAEAMLRKQYGRENDYKLVFVDDELGGSNVNGKPVIDYEEFRGNGATRKYVSIAIADAGVRRLLFNRCQEDDIQPFTVRADNAVVLAGVDLGAGAILSPFVTLTSNITIGLQFQANIYSYVGHDCRIGDYVTFAPAVKCNGNVVIENSAYLGTGCVIKQGSPASPVVIGEGAVVGMGAVVTKSVAAGAVVVGNPAKPLVKD